jgi:hypothetical protein
MFCDGMTPEQRAFSLSVLIPDATTLAREPIFAADPFRPAGC